MSPSPTLITFPPMPRTAHRIACRLRTDGFYSLPQRTWNNVADLVEHLAHEAPTNEQRLFLWRTRENFLAMEH